MAIGLVWGTHVSIDPTAYPPPLRSELERHLARARAYRSQRPSLGPGPELKMVHQAWVAYERRLAAVSDDRAAARLASEYVDQLRSCYEWEGYHDCPEHEAAFADKYQAAHPTGPLSEYLPLLSAHRWLCTAEADEYEKRPTLAGQVREVYQQRIRTARQARGLLVRTAAERLFDRNRCHTSR